MKVSLNVALLFFGAAAPVLAQDGPKPMQTFFVPLPEQALFDSGFEIINTAATSPVVSLISFAISTDNTVIWYDHWEGGYESDPTKPTSPNTLIWGDGNATNGCAPDIVVCSHANDKLLAGDSIVVQNDIPVPRSRTDYSGTILFDGGDKVMASFPITMTRGAYPSKPGSLMAGGVEILDTDNWGTAFVAPIGQGSLLPNSTTKLFDAFEYTAMYIMASRDGTEITMPDGTKSYLSQGQGTNVEVKMGDRITSSQPVQVDLITGDRSSSYEMRWFALIPSSEWSDDYYSPVGDSVGRVRSVLYNDATTAIQVSVSYLHNVTKVLTTETIDVKPKAYALSPVIPSGSGAQLKSVTAGSNFLALTVIDGDQASWTGGQWFDWGFPVVPRNMLTPQVLVGWGYGCTNNTCPSNEPVRSVVWVTAVADADVYIDYSNIGKDFEVVNVKRLQGIKIRDNNDPKKDMSGAFIFATVPGSGFNGTSVDIAAAWGQDPSVSEPNQAISLDLGTVVLPFSGVRVSKIADKKEVIPGEKLRYTIRIVNVGQVDLKALDFAIVDPTLTDQMYIPGSTTYYNGVGGSQLVADNKNGTAFPLDGAGLRNLFVLPRRGGIHEISFDVVVNAGSLTKKTVVNTGYLERKSGTKIPFEVTTPVRFLPNIKIENTVYPGQNNGASCSDPSIAVEKVEAVLHSLVTYCYKVTNIGQTWLKNPTIDNPLLKASHSSTSGFLLGPQQSYTLHYDTVQDVAKTPVRVLGDLQNVATVTAKAVWPNGADLDPTLPLVRHSDPSEVRSLSFVPSVQIENRVFAGVGDCVTNGAELANGFMNTPCTYCFTVTNTGNTILRQLIVTDNDIKPTFTNTRDVILRPGESYVLTSASLIDGQYSNNAIVVASPALPDGTILSHLDKVTDDDLSSIATKPIPVGDVRSTDKDPYVPPTTNQPDTPTECMTPHWRDAGGKQDLICRASDITVKSLTSSRATCKEGDKITVTVNAELLFKAGLYDPAWFVATDGGDAKLGSCILKGLVAGNNYTVTDPDDGLSIGSVVWNDDAIGGNDNCGDVLIPGGNGIVSGSFFVGVEMKCIDTNDDGSLDFAVCFSWRSPATDGFCTLNNNDLGTKGILADVYPADNMKCRCVRAELPTVSVEKRVSDRGVQTC